MLDDLLAKVHSRFVSYAEAGGVDHSLVLGDEAEAEARELWRAAVAAARDGSPGFGVLEALGWLHWARYNALPVGKDRDDLQAAAVLFATIYLIDKDRLPDELKTFLDSGKAEDVEDVVGAPASSPFSYVAEQYPSAVDHVAHLQEELRHIPMPSADKPDINGYREGDRVRLVNSFNGSSAQYEAGREGTILVTNTSPAQVRLGREADLVEVYIDDGSLIMTSSKALERISGQAEVIYSDDGETVRIVR